MRPRHRGTVAAVRSQQAETSCQAGKGSHGTRRYKHVRKSCRRQASRRPRSARIGNVECHAEIRNWEERRDKLLGLDKVQVDITSGGKEFKGFSSVLPVMPGIDEIVRRIDEERERKLSEEDV